MLSPSGEVLILDYKASSSYDSKIKEDKMNKEDVKKWWEDNKDDIKFGASIFAMVYCSIRCGYIIGKRDGYLQGICDVFSSIDQVKKF